MGTCITQIALIRLINRGESSMKAKGDSFPALKKSVVCFGDTKWRIFAYLAIK
jgi:hypothetical protein